MPVPVDTNKYNARPGIVITVTDHDNQSTGNTATPPSPPSSQTGNRGSNPSGVSAEDNQDTPIR